MDFGLSKTCPLCIILLMLLIWLAPGCNMNEPVPTHGPVTVTAQPDELWQLCQVQLKSFGFQLDRVDRRDGVIETFPLTSKQWFEFWRKDVVTSDDLLLSSLHTVRRIINRALPRPRPSFGRSRS